MASFVDHLADAEVAEGASRAELLHGGDGGADIGRRLGGRGRHEPGDGLAVLGDGDLFPLRDALEDLGRVSLGLA